MEKNDLIYYHNEKDNTIESAYIFDITKTYITFSHSLKGFKRLPSCKRIPRSLTKFYDLSEEEMAKKAIDRINKEKEELTDFLKNNYLKKSNFLDACEEK